jgi:hypothetical protein
MSENRPRFNPETHKPPQREIEPIEDVTSELFEIHEVTDVFDRIGYPLHPELQQLLGEYNPKEEEPGGERRHDRRGSGFTQATYRLAKYTRHPRGFHDLKLLDHHVVEKIEAALFRQHEKKREQTISEKIDAHFARKHRDADDTYDTEGEFEPTNKAIYDAVDRTKIRQAVNSITSEGGKLVGNLIADILCPETLPDTIPILPPSPEDLRFGACTTAEKYFLEFANKHEPHEYRHRLYQPTNGHHMNVITDHEGKPLMVEKIGLGENHSCITLKETALNGVRLPPGSLVGIRYRADQKSVLDNANKDSSEQIIPLSAIEAVQFLRLTTLAASPQERTTTFRAHIEHQKNNNMTGHSIATIEDIRKRAVAIQESKLSLLQRIAKKIAA